MQRGLPSSYCAGRKRLWGERLLPHCGLFRLLHQPLKFLSIEIYIQYIIIKLWTIRQRRRQRSSMLFDCRISFNAKRQYRGEIFELLMGPKSWVELIPLRPGQLERYSEEDLILLNSSEFKNLASDIAPVWSEEKDEWKNGRLAEWQNGCFIKMDDNLVHTTCTNPPPSQNGCSSKHFS